MSQKSLIDERTIALIEELRRDAESFVQATTGATDYVPFAPWDSENPPDLNQFDEQNKPLSDAFRLSQAENAMIETYKPESPGNIGDSMVLAAQLDYAALLERAYRARHLQSFPRMIAHTVNRKRLQAAPDGSFGGQVIGTFANMLNQAAETRE